MSVEEVKQRIDQIIADEEYDGILPLLLFHKELTEQDNDLATVCYLCIIYEQEKKAGCPVIFSKVSNMEELVERYTRLKFYLRRIEFCVTGNQMGTFYEFLTRNRVSSYELLQVIDFSVIHKEKVLEMIKGGAENMDTTSRDSQEKVICTENTDMDVEEKTRSVSSSVRMISFMRRSVFIISISCMCRRDTELIF